MDDGDVVFYRRNKMYVADFSEWLDGKNTENNENINLMTTQERESLLTSKEVKKALEAKEFLRKAGYPSPKEANHLVNDGNVLNIPHTGEHIRNYFDTYGAMVESVRGKTTKQHVKVTESNAKIGKQRTMQTLTSDVMFADEEMFLISIASPLELTVCSHVSSTNKTQLGKAIQTQINLLRSRGFEVAKIFVDPQPALKAIQFSFPGIEIDVSGAGDHLDKVDAKIRRIKEMMRSVLAGLPFTLPKLRIKDLATYVVSRINTRRTTASSDNVSPRVKFTGRKILYREFQLGFGDYVEAYNPTAEKKSNNIRMERTEPCIALYPSANLNGSWIFWNLRTKMYVRRTQWRSMITLQAVIDQINTMSGNIRIDVGDTIETEGVEEEEDPIRDTMTTHTPTGEPTTAYSTNEEALISENEDDEDHDESLTADRGELDSEQTEATIEEEPVISAPTMIDEGRPRRSTAGVRQQDPIYEWNFMNLSVKTAIKNYGKPAIDACIGELNQMFNSKKVLVPVKWHSLTTQQRQKIVRSHMFLKEKYDAHGLFEKIKARLVGDGRMQDRTVYKITKSPTPANGSIMGTLKITAVENRHFSKLDVGGAYLNARIDDEEEVFMELNAELSRLAVQWMPSLKEFLPGNGNGRLLVRVEKALYGLIQSAFLWNQHLTKFLESKGFVKNVADPCVMNKMHNGYQITIVVYVDDLLVTSTLIENVEWVKDILRNEFKEISVEEGNSISYLGMIVKKEESGIIINMKQYIKGIIEFYGKQLKKATTPAKLDLHEVTTKENEKPCDDAVKFHSTVAKLLYLAKRARPDILLATQHLCTKVKAPTQQDQQNLERVLGFLMTTINLNKVISNKAYDCVTAYIDAAFGSHIDGKSHTGATICLGNTSVIEISRKQRIVTKDSTEAELVALSDILYEVDNMHQFMESQGICVKKYVIYQDNKSTISLVTAGGGRPRTKHMRARQYMVKEQVDNGNLEVIYKPTNEMIADVLTKPLGGASFFQKAGFLLGRVELVLP